MRRSSATSPAGANAHPRTPAPGSGLWLAMTLVLVGNIIGSASSCARVAPRLRLTRAEPRRHRIPADTARGATRAA